MIEHGETVLVAVSGGPDSTALLHCLALLRAEWQLTLAAAHLNHGFRGEEADGDSDYVAALCSQLGVNLVRERVDVPKVAARRHLSSQEAARDVRHAFLRRVAAQVGAAHIALGHTRDDRVETILLNLLRGTGPEGLAGFPPVAAPLIRPLYDVTRTEVSAYCAANGLQPRSDSSNSNLDYLRNRTRTELLPYLRSYYNEKADAVLLRIAELISADNEVLDDLAGQHRARIAQSIQENEVLVARDGLMALPAALQRRLLRQVIADIRGHLKGVTFDLIHRTLAALETGANFGATLPMSESGSVTVSCSPVGVRIALAQPATDAMPWQTALAIPGATDLHRCGVSIHAALCATPQEAESLFDAAYLRSAVAYGNMQGVAFRSDDLALPLVARSWRPGDRIRLPGLNGRKKLQDLFVDRKIPARARMRHGVIAASDGEILAVIGVAAAEKALVVHDRHVMGTDQQQTPLLVLMFHPLEFDAAGPDTDLPGAVGN
jgi:tRNA(Ile)-lysidine synthase